MYFRVAEYFYQNNFICTIKIKDQHLNRTHFTLKKSYTEIHSPYHYDCRAKFKKCIVTIYKTTKSNY